MSLNLASLQQKADQVIHNADEAIRKWQEFITAPAGTVNLEYYDKNGNLQQVSFDNRNKLVQNFISNVNSAMSKTFYVDSINGNDNNDGSQANPFKTIKKAIDSVPVGGVGKIYLIAGQTYNINKDIIMFNKRIFIYGDQTSHPTLKNNAYLDSNNYVYAPGFGIQNGQLVIRYCDIQTPNYPSGAVGLNRWEGFVVKADTVFGSFQLYNCNVILGDTDLIRISAAPYTLFVDIYGGSITRSGSNRDAYVVYNEGGIFGLGAVSVDIGSLTWNDLLYGIVKDSNGVPRNIVSNIIF